MTMWRTQAGAAILAAGLAFAGATYGQAADMATDQQAAFDQEVAPDWQFVIAPYFWMAGLKGKVASFGAPPVDVDVKFSDILNSLDFSIMMVSEARYGRFSLSSDFLYLKISTDKTTPLGILATSIGLGNETLEFTALGGYALIDTPNGHLDLVAGARLWSVDNSLSFTGGILGGIGLSDGATWIDAMAGVKGRADITDRVYVTGWALAGGGSSDSSWDVMGGIGYRFNDRFSSVLGYRAAGVDYQDGPFLFDVTMQGPILGAVLRF